MTINPKDMSFDIVYRMRGYVVNREEQCVVSIQAPNAYSIENLNLTGSQRIVLKE